MRRVLLAGVAMALGMAAASAADLPRRAPPPVYVPPPLFTWTGVYIGTHTAYTFTGSDRITTVGNDPFAQFIVANGTVPGSVATKSFDRFAKFGGGFGINYQLTPGSGFVIGAAIDADWTGVHKNTAVLGAPFLGIQPTNVYERGLGYLATANARLGYAFDRLLVYATGGAAIGKVEYAHSLYTLGFLTANGSDGATEVGFNYGGGIEYAIPKDSFLGGLSPLKLIGIDIGGNVTLKAEYVHYDLGSRNVLVNDFVFGSTATTRFKTEGDMVRAGFSYKFP